MVWVTSIGPMLNRFRQSLALRLAALYSVAFAAGACVLFGVLYWMLGRALEDRDRIAVEHRAETFANAYEAGGPAALRAVLSTDDSPDVRSLFVRILGSDGEATLAKVPSDWVGGPSQQFLVPDGWGGWRPQESRSVRVPQDAARDFAVASRVLGDGRLLQVARSTDSRYVLLAPLRRAFLTVGLVALLLSAAAGSILAWRATSPLRAVATTTREILETGDLRARVPSPQGSGELAVLVRQLNTLLGRNAAHVQVLRETLDNIAHDLRTPLTRLRGTAELALLGGSDPVEARGALADCVEESDRTLHLLEALLDVSAAEAGALKLNLDRVDLRTVVDRSVQLYKEVAEERKIAVTVEETSAVEAMADPVRLGQAISNVIDNALKYTPEGGRVTVSAETLNGRAVVKVSDSGPGVPASERDAIWRRLYRSDSSRSQRGYGLGLSLVKAIVEAHKGTAEVAEGPSGGALFTISIPAV